MNTSSKPELLTPNDFAYLLQVMNRLVEQGIITVRHKEETARRIAEEYELAPLYI
jgi:DNA-binding PadR family transcriptional regulator